MVAFKSKKISPNLLFFLTALVIFALGHFLIRNINIMADEYAHSLAVSKMLETGILFPRSGLSSLWGYHWTIAFLITILRDSSTATFRFSSLVLSFLCIIAFFFTAKKIEKDSAIQKSFLFLLFPLIFPFFFVIYTDVYAMLFVFLALFFALEKRLWISGICGILGILVRQNNIIWLAFIALLVYCEDYYPQYRWKEVKQWILKFLFYFLAAIALIAFAVWNKGLALAGNEFHYLTLHPGNVFLFLFLFFFLFLPSNLLNAFKILSYLKQHLLLWFILTLLFTVHVFFFNHYPRCNSFARFLHNWLVFWMTTPSFSAKAISFLPIAYSILSLCVTRLQRKSFYLLYPFTALSLMVLPIIEIRYAFIPFAFFLLFKQKDSEKITLATLATYVIPNICIIYLIIDGSFFP